MPAFEQNAGRYEQGRSREDNDAGVTVQEGDELAEHDGTRKNAAGNRWTTTATLGVGAPHNKDPPWLYVRCQTESQCALG
jgi:hypothetical protein